MWRPVCSAALPLQYTNTNIRCVNKVLFVCIFLIIHDWCMYLENRPNVRGHTHNEWQTSSNPTSDVYHIYRVKLYYIPLLIPLKSQYMSAEKINEFKDSLCAHDKRTSDGLDGRLC